MEFFVPLKQKVLGEAGSNSSTLKVNGRVCQVVAAGGSSALMGLFGYTPASSDKYKLHFGAALVQTGSWYMAVDGDWTQGKVLVIEHFGDRLKISVSATLDQAIATFSKCYGPDCPLEVLSQPMGGSNAAVARFLGPDVVTQMAARSYSAIYAYQGGPFFKRGETNCLRMVLDLYLFLKVDYLNAYRMTFTSMPKDQLSKEAKRLVLDNDEFQRAIESVLTFYTRIGLLTSGHPKMKKTVGQLNKQFEETTGLTVSEVGSRLKRWQDLQAIPVVSSALRFFALL